MDVIEYFINIGFRFLGFKLWFWRFLLSSNYPEVIFTVFTDNDVLQDTQRLVKTIDSNNLNSLNRAWSVYTTVADASANTVPYLTSFTDLSPAKNYIYIVMKLATATN